MKPGQGHGEERTEPGCRYAGTLPRRFIQQIAEKNDHIGLERKSVYFSVFAVSPRRVLPVCNGELRGMLT